ncbi:MAG: 16S rRNA (guanine(527)-N(7))-methyltransferase RsmG [Clostridiales bacterium]|nr:16S rRNA (guanine(527)-N(7))-methyltransferase RsmG [Clostridiales bacterium]
MDISSGLTKFKSGLQEMGIDLTEEQIHQFLQYYDLLIERNKVMNLTAITEFDEVVEKHFLDSLSLVKIIPDLSDQTVLDMGTGAGFPGIPLKIVFPRLNFVLADSLNKRVKFLSEVIDELRLSDIKAVHGRAEDLARNPEYRQKFDLCVSRAVANLSSLSEYCLPFVKKNGFFVSYKSAEVEQELADAKKAVFLLGGKTEQVLKFHLPLSDYNRSLILIKKERDTPKAYPRKAGTPAKNPL